MNILKEGVSRRALVQGIIGAAAASILEAAAVHNKPEASAEYTQNLPLAAKDAAQEKGVIAPAEITVPETQIRLRYAKPDADDVLVATSPFTNPMEAARLFAGKPGGTLVSGDFGEKASGNPHGDNPRGWVTMWEAGGSIREFNALNQEGLKGEAPYAPRIQANGFVMVFLYHGKTSRGDYETVWDPQRDDFVSRWVRTHDEEILPPEPGTMYCIVDRGEFRTMRINAGGNHKLRVSGFKPGDGEVREYGSRDTTNLAFIDPDHFAQAVKNAHRGEGNCGPAGCGRLLLIVGDPFNSGGKEVWEHRVTDRNNVDPYRGWKRLFTNVRSNTSLQQVRGVYRLETDEVVLPNKGSVVYPKE